MENQLIGKTLSAIHIASDKTAIKFDIAGEESVIALCGEFSGTCTWVEHVELPALGLPSVVSQVDDIDINGDLDTNSGRIESYGLKITTNKGHIIIVYRNESDGSYGGWIDLLPYSDFCDFAREQCLSDQFWLEVKEDI